MIKVLPERLCGNPIRLDQFVPYDELKNAIEVKGREYGIPIVVEMDEVKVGKGLTALAVSADPCLVVYHANHRKDYYNYILTQTLQGNFSFLSQYLGGDSKNYRNKTIGENSRSLVANIVGGRAKKKYQEESMYYDIVNEVIGQALEYLGFRSC